MLSCLKRWLRLDSGKSGKPTEKYVGPLHNQLTGGDFSLSGFAPLIEGRFIEVNENLQLADQSGDVTAVRIALVVIMAGSAIPAMLFAEDGSSEEELKIRRLYPLWRIKFSLDEATCTLRVATSKGVSQYKLLVPVEADPDYVSRWLMIISLLDDS